MESRDDSAVATSSVTSGFAQRSTGHEFAPAGAGIPGWLFTSYVTIGVASLLIAGTLNKSINADYLTMITVGLPTVAVVWYAVLRPRHSFRRPWLMLALALTCFMAGEAIWTLYTFMDEDPFPSIADLFFVCGYLPLVISAVQLAPDADGFARRTAWLDAVIFTLVCALVFWQSVVSESAGVAVTQAILVSHFYAGLDLLAFAFILRTLLLSPKPTSATLVFSLGLVTTMAADIAHCWLEWRGQGALADDVQPLWMLGYLCFGSAALLPSAQRSAPVSQSEDPGVLRLVTVLLVTLTPLLVVLRELISSAAPNWTTVTAALSISAITMMLVVMRMWALVSRTQQLESARGTERLSTLIHHSSDAILLLDTRGCITFTSPAWALLWGFSAQESAGHSIYSFLDDDSIEAMRNQLGMAYANDHLAAAVPVDGLLRAANGALRDFEGTARNLVTDDNVRAMVLTLRDTTERRQLESQLARRAFHDDLTGLANRALLADRIEQALLRRVRQPQLSVAVLFLDLDDFKAVNDGAGHATGDKLLIEVARRLRAAVRPMDTVARLGGDEFAILMEGPWNEAEVRDSAQRVLSKLEEIVTIGELQLNIPASIGMVIAAPDDNVESLLRHADLAMYDAKSKGKCCIAMFDARLRERAREHLALKVDLPIALAENQFHLMYQPIQKVADGSLHGFEALLRWRHPERGLISPAEFIPSAEETGMIIPIGRWVLREACRQCAEWNRGFDQSVTIAVNVSALQIARPDFIGDLRSLLTEVGLSPDHLTIELTESVLADTQVVEPVLQSLRDMGVAIAIDDFGTGYSSLAYLQRLPVSTIKVDRAFVQELSAAGTSTLVESILSIARALRLTTVAEGVETADQLTALIDLGCDRAQGYHLGRPMEVRQVEALLRGETTNPLRRSVA
ncbi:MAG: EAL domain-containing protein [Pseudomonadales bacterium]|nr:EAL domain-containing protein [Pseudomonadales bacterium]